MEAFDSVETVKMNAVENHFSSDCGNKSTEMPTFATQPEDCQYFAVKTEAEDLTEQKVYCLTSREDQNILDQRTKDMILKPWILQMNSSLSTDQKVNIPEISKPYLCNLQSLPSQEESLFQVDYRTRNKIKTKRRRMDPDYRDQERLRQRTVMQMKRQNPEFRAEERKKGRCRMRIKRLDPLFRTQERERQRERMKIKRLDPNFREREREQQKTRIHEKRLDPEFREKEKTRGRLRTHTRTDDAQMLEIPKQKEVMPLLENSELKATGSTYVQISRQVNIAQTNTCQQSQQITGLTSVVLRTGDALFDSFRYIPPNAFNIHLHCNVREHLSTDKNCKPIYNMIKNSLEDAVHQESDFFSKQCLPHVNDCTKPKISSIKNKFMESSKTVSSAQTLDKKFISSQS